MLNNEEIIKEVKDTIAKAEGSINILKSDPVILTYNKLLGIRQKLVALLRKLSQDREQDTDGKMG